MASADLEVKINVQLICFCGYVVDLREEHDLVEHLIDYHHLPLTREGADSKAVPES